MFEQALSVGVPNLRLCNSHKLTRATQCPFLVVPPLRRNSACHWDPKPTRNKLVSVLIINKHMKG